MGQVGGIAALMSYGAFAILSVPMTNGAYFVLSLLIILIVLVPFCAAMGATFPVALSFFGSSEESQNTQEGRYFANVSGAIYGAVLPAFLALEWLGFQKTIYLAVAANWLIDLLFWNAVPAIKPSKGLRYRIPAYWVFSVSGTVGSRRAFRFGNASLAWKSLARIYVFFYSRCLFLASILAMYLAFTALGTNFYRRRLASGNFDVAKLWIGLAPAALPGFGIDPSCACNCADAEDFYRRCAHQFSSRRGDAFAHRQMHSFRALQGEHRLHLQPGRLHCGPLLRAF